MKDFSTACKVLQMPPALSVGDFIVGGTCSPGSLNIGPSQMSNCNYASEEVVMVSGHSNAASTLSRSSDVLLNMHQPKNGKACCLCEEATEPDS